jgi:hypothetical protein
MEGECIENMLAGWKRIAFEIPAKGHTRALSGGGKRSHESAHDDQGITRLSSDMEGNIDYIVEAFGGSSDLVIRRLRAGKSGSVPAAIIHLDGLVDGHLVAQGIIRSVTALTENLASPAEVLDELHGGLISVAGVSKATECPRSHAANLGWRLCGADRLRTHSAAMQCAGVGTAQPRGAEH